MTRLCSVKGCCRQANAAAVYCDKCDSVGPDGRPAGAGWSRSRDEAWIGYKTVAEIDSCPVASAERNASDGS